MLKASRSRVSSGQSSQELLDLHFIIDGVVFLQDEQLFTHGTVNLDYREMRLVLRMPDDVVSSSRLVDPKSSQGLIYRDLHTMCRLSMSKGNRSEWWGAIERSESQVDEMLTVHTRSCTRCPT